MVGIGIRIGIGIGCWRVGRESLTLALRLVGLVVFTLGIEWIRL